MKAIIYTSYGSPSKLHLAEVEKPVPKDNQILIKIYAASLNAYDWRHLKPDPFMMRFMGGGVFKPKHPILGADMSGVVEAVGRKVTQFKPGDAVFGEGHYGGLAEYACVDEKGFILKPENMTFKEAAAIPMAGLTALQGLRDKGNIQAGQKVLVNGASGGVGSFAVQIAKSFGAEVTGVCSTGKMDLVKSIGADHVVDYTREDITMNGKIYDLIFDTAAHRSVTDYLRILKPGGPYVLAGGSISRLMQTMLKSRSGNKNMVVMICSINQKDLLFLTELFQSGKLKPAIDKVIPLSESAEAMRYLQKGSVRGKVVITI